jgi:tetratricopeptide (TPR) repeat protein
VVSVGCAVPETSTRNYSTLQRRLLPHAQACSRQRIKSKASWCLRDDKGKDEDVDKEEEGMTVLHAIHQLGMLYANQGKLGEAEQMYERALRGYEAALGSDLSQQYRPALNTLENKGDLYPLQAEIPKAQAMYARALSALSVVLGQSSERCMKLAAKIDALPSPRRQREGQSKLPTVVERSAPQHDRTKKSSRLPIRKLVKK